MVTITLSDATYHRLSEAAAAVRLPLDQYLDRIATVRADERSRPVQGTPQWEDAFNKWVTASGRRGIVADDSRDTIYEDDERD